MTQVQIYFIMFLQTLKFTFKVNYEISSSPFINNIFVQCMNAKEYIFLLEVYQHSLENKKDMDIK